MRFFIKLLLILSSIFQPTALGRRNLIQNLKVTRSQIIVEPERYLTRKYLDNPQFIVNYENDIDLTNLDYQTVTAPFILSVISLVWVSGKTYHIEKMDKNLAKSLEIIRKVYETFYPQLTFNGKLVADEYTQNIPTINDENTIGICFSGGLDSTYSSKVLENKKQLLMTIHGFSEEADYGRWQTIKEHVTDFANNSGNKRPFFVCSNFRRITLGPKLANLFPDFIPWREYFQESISLAGIAIPILAAHNVQELIIPSTFTWDFPYAWGSHPYIDNNIRFRNITVLNHLPNLTRKNKIEYFKQQAEEGIQRPTLYTCRHAENCGPCGSCMKGVATVNTLLLCGENPQDYGYANDRTQTMNETRRVFSLEWPFDNFDKSEAMGWQKIQLYAKELLKDQSLDQEFKNYLQWLIAIDFFKFVNNHRDFQKSINLKKHAYFLRKPWQIQFLKKRGF